MQIDKYSIGTGDRFGTEGKAQLKAIELTRLMGSEVVPVWNKSNREHSLTGTRPIDTRKAADEAVRKAGYSGSYFVDADHIGYDTVDDFAACCDFFTIDVANFIGKPAAEDDRKDFLNYCRQWVGVHKPAGLENTLQITEQDTLRVADNYLEALKEVNRIYNKILALRGNGEFITEVSMDEADLVQNPAELFLILSGLSRLGIPVLTIAPRFPGLFAKGIDYAGDTIAFFRVFEECVAMLKYATSRLSLPPRLKISVHSGSDKFSLYPGIGAIIRKHQAGLHLKTAGTTWLEEVIGLAASGGAGLELAQEIYSEALLRYDELTRPYASVLHLQRNELPPACDVEEWDSGRFVAALTHDRLNQHYNPHFRQLIHVGYKVAAEMGKRFTDALFTYRNAVETRVTFNLFERHLKPLFCKH